MKKLKGSYFSYFMMYMFYYLGMALFGALISVYLMNKGYNASQVSIVTAASFVASMIVQPLIGILSDRYNKRTVNAAILVISGILGIAFIDSTSFILIVGFYALGYGLLNGANPVIEAMATHSKHKYGLIRIWGTIGYAVGSRLAGLIYENISPSAMYLFYAFAMILCAFGLVGTQDVITTDTKEESSDKGIFGNKTFLFYLLILVLFYGSASANSLYLPTMYESIGLSVSNVTRILFVCTMMEFVVVLFLGKYFNHISNKHLLMSAFISLMIQFGTYSFLPWTIAKIIITIVTKSVTTMAFIMINLKVVSTIVSPKIQNTALEIAASVESLASILFQLIGGRLIDMYSYQAFYLFLLITAILGFFLSSLFKVDSGNDLNLF